MVHSSFFKLRALKRARTDESTGDELESNGLDG